MFTKELNHDSFIQMFPGSKLGVPDPKQVTIMGWIRPEAVNEGTVIVSVLHCENCSGSFKNKFNKFTPMDHF